MITGMPSASALPLLADLRQVEQLGRLRDGQRAWRAWPLRRRLAVVRACRERLADDGLHLAASVRPDSSRALHETITAELLPLLAACRFLEREAPRLPVAQLVAPCAHRRVDAFERTQCGDLGRAAAESLRCVHAGCAGGLHGSMPQHCSPAVPHARPLEARL